MAVASHLWWPLYFPAETYDARDRRAELSEQLIAYFSSEAGFRMVEQTVPDESSGYAVALDFGQMELHMNMPDVFAALDMAPLEALACLSAAVHVVALLSPLGLSRLGHLQPTSAASRVRIHLYNRAATTVAFRGVRSNTVGSMVTVRGTVVRVSAVRSLVTSMPFVCSSCGSKQLVPQPEGCSAKPKSCASTTCRGRKFEEERDGALCVDMQRLKLQELPCAGSSLRFGGGDGEPDECSSRTLEVELHGTLCDAAASGDVLTVTGFVRALAEKEAAGGKEEERAKTFLLHLEAVSLVRAPRMGDEGDDDAQARVLLAAFSGDGADTSANFGGAPMPPPFSDKELAFVARFAAEAARGGPACGLRMLVNSLCPSIHGHLHVKAGLILSLLGGTRLHDASPDAMPVRGEIHALVVGDPGLGKSQLLGAVAAASPKGVYVCGPGSTAVGLTAAVGRDAATGTVTLDAGACVLAHRGVCAVDELDKLPRQQHAALLEVMEQGTVSIAKAGITASLPARCAVVAAANPLGGRYNPAKTLLQNLNLSAPLLSRFDLIFLLRDAPDERADAAMAAHVLGRAGRPPQMRRLEGPRGRQALPAPADGAPTTFTQRLRAQADEEPLPMPLLRKYIEYARKYLRPSLSLEAEAVIKDFYLSLRARASRSPGALPVTVRTLEALARLCEARARADLRHSATRDDALDVVALMKEALPDTFTGEPLPGAYSCGAGGGSSSLQGEPRRFLAALAAEARTKDGGYLSYAECVAVADRIGLNVPDVLALVERLNYDGELLKHGRLYTVTGVKPAAADVEQEEGLSPTERAQRRGWSSR